MTALRSLKDQLITFFQPTEAPTHLRLVANNAGANDVTVEAPTAPAKPKSAGQLVHEARNRARKAERLERKARNIAAHRARNEAAKLAAPANKD